MSLPSTPSTKFCPIPGTANTFSTTNDPVSAVAVAGPRYERTGRNAFLSACLNATRQRGRPFARAVRMWSAPISSIMPKRMSREMYAANGSDSVNAGSATNDSPPQPPTGEIPSLTAKSMSSALPITKLGRLMPAIARSCVNASIGEPGLSPPIVPATMPSTSAMSIAESPSVIDTGRPVARISFTLQSGCLSDGPRSNGLSSLPSRYDTPLALPR